MLLICNKKSYKVNNCYKIVLFGRKNKMNKKIIGIFLCIMMIAVVATTTGDNNRDPSFNNPPIANAGGPYIGEEGLELIFDASGSFDPDGDPLSYRWDFDGDEIWDTEWSTDPFYIYAYGDDYYNNSFVEVSDGIASSYASAPCFIVNVAPEAEAGNDQTVNEGVTVILEADVYDVGFDDKHVLCWDFDMNDTMDLSIKPPRFVPGPGFQWDDGSGSRTMVINLTTNSFKVNDFHWDVENGILHLIYFPPSKWHVEETKPGKHFDGSTTDWPLARPAWTTDSFTVSMEPDSNGKFKMTFTITLNHAPINKGVIEFDTNKRSMSPTITEVVYGDDGTYFLWFYVTDDDGGTAEDTVNVTVLNLPPEIEPFGPISGGPGKPVEIAGTATDSGSDDLTFTWNFGDGSPVVTNIYYNDGLGPDESKGSCNGTFPFVETDTVTHTYASKGNYIIVLTVEDDNGGISEYTTNVNIPRSKTVIRPFIYFLQNHPKIFPLMQLFLQRFIL